MTRTASLLVLLVALAACGDNSNEAHTTTSKHAVTVGELTLRWGFLVLNPTNTQTGEGSRVVIKTDSDRMLALNSVDTAKSKVCHGDASCMRGVFPYFWVEVCVPEPLECTYPKVAAAVGWVNMVDRYDQETIALVAFMEAQNQPAEAVRLTLEYRQHLQSNLATEMADLQSGKSINQLAQQAHDRLATMGAAATSAEQVHLADTRRTIAALDKITADYQSGLNALQPLYGDVAARHTAYRNTESTVFAGITALATQASTADLTQLASLKVRLAEQSDSENRVPQLLLLDAQRTQAELGNLQATYAASVAPHAAYLTENSLPILDHTTAPRAGMTNAITYANGRIQRVNEAIRAIYDGIRRREAALSLAAADAATRDQLRATDDADRETAFLNDMTVRAADVWTTPPTSALSLPLQGERLTTMTAFLQLEGICKDVALAAAWRGPGCQKVTAETSKIRTYLTQTLPFTLRFGVVKMRAAGFDATVLADIEAKVTAGDLVTAVHIYDATLRAAEGN
jgi:hypothetical protein